MALGRAKLEELAAGVDVSWQRRPQRQRSIRPIIPSGWRAMLPRYRLQVSAGDGVCDDQAERDGRHLVALLFVAGTPLRRAEAAEALRVSRAGSSGRVRS